MGRINIPRLTYDLTDHCNLRCSGCDQASPWHGTRFTKLSSFEEDFRFLCSVCDVGELSFAGGEPLQHPQLIQFLQSARKHSFARELRIITNGVLLQKLTQAALEYLDYIVISLYPGVRYRHDFRAFATLAKKQNVFVGVVMRQQFRRALVNSAIESKEAIEAIHRSCILRDYCHTVYDGRYYRCPRAHRLEPRMRVIGTTVANRDSDSVMLRGNANLRADMTDYLAEETPLNACTYCLGTVGDTMPVVQMNRTRLQAEQGARQAPLSLLDPSIDLRNPPERESPQEGWSKHVFETLSDFLDRVETSGKSIEQFVAGEST